MSDSPINPGMFRLCHSPVIGVLTQPISDAIESKFDGKYPDWYLPNGSFIKGTMIEWLERAGAEIVAVPFDTPKPKMRRILQRLHGFVFPGGPQPLTDDPLTPFMEASLYIYETILSMGADIPCLMICQGFEQCCIFEAGPTILSDHYLVKEATPFHLTEEFKHYLPTADLLEMHNARQADRVAKRSQFLSEIGEIAPSTLARPLSPSSSHALIHTSPQPCTSAAAEEHTVRPPILLEEMPDAVLKTLTTKKTLSNVHAWGISEHDFRQVMSDSYHLIATDIDRDNDSIVAVIERKRRHKNDPKVFAFQAHPEADPSLVNPSSYSFDEEVDNALVWIARFFVSQVSLSTRAQWPQDFLDLLRVSCYKNTLQTHRVQFPGDLFHVYFFRNWNAFFESCVILENDETYVDFVDPLKWINSKWKLKENTLHKIIKPKRATQSNLEDEKAM